MKALIRVHRDENSHEKVIAFHTKTVRAKREVKSGILGRGAPIDVRPIAQCSASGLNFAPLQLR
jgi:hypothetical protein